MATPFTKQSLVEYGGYVSYQPEGGTYTDRTFVARFKNGRGGKGTFMTFLRKHFTVEEYFERLEAGETPLGIVESKGYILPHIKKWLKKGGYPVTREGYKQYVKDQVAAWKANR